MKIFIPLTAMVLFAFRLIGADVPASVMAYKDSGRLASPTNLFYTNLVAGTNIIFEPIGSGRLKIHGTGGGGGIISSVDPDFFQVLAGQLNLTNQNLVDWSQFSTNTWNDRQGGSAVLSNLVATVDQNVTNAQALYFSISAGLLSLTNGNLIDWAKMSTNLFATETELNTASNLLRTDVANLQSATNGLNTRVGSLETATNGLNTRVGVVEAQTNSWDARQGGSDVLSNLVTTVANNVTNVASLSVSNATSKPLINSYTAGVLTLPGIEAGANVTITGNGSNYVIASSNPGGTVTSVGLVAPSIFGITNSPITGSGNIGFTNVNQTANTVYAGPTSGGVAEPTFRALVAADIPAATQISLTHAGTVTLDCSAILSEADFTGCTGSVVFATSNLAAAHKYVLFGQNTNTVNVTATFPSWEWQVIAPVSITAGKSFEIVLESRGTTDANVWAAYSEEP